jgi:hypothetical protein
MLTKKQMERLEPFLKHKRARQRIILYLLADGSSVHDVVKTTKRVLLDTVFPEELEIFVEQVADEIPELNDGAFCYPGGAFFKTQDIYRIVRQATEGLLGKPLKVVDFRQYVVNSKYSAFVAL